MNLALLFGLLAVAVWIYMSLWFFTGQYFRRTDVADTAWGLGFVYIALLALLIMGNNGWTKTLTLLLVTVWGLRLSLHITLRDIRQPEDSRYQVFRQQWGTQFAAKAYVRIFMLQGLLLLLISTATIAIISSDASPNRALAWCGFAVWTFGIAFESLADWQLRRFLQRPGKLPHAIMQNGLWKYSRHPNYFGEITTWCGAGLVACSVSRPWGLIGAVVIAVLITKVSGVPILEKHYAKNRNYQAYKRRTSVLIPWPPKQ